MQKWEYLCMPENFISTPFSDIKGQADAMGKMGWELVGAAHVTEEGSQVLLYKRPLPNPPILIQWLLALTSRNGRTE